MIRNIVHMDLDSFFVSVELLKRPYLAGKPVIVGGSSDRGVVASCSYEARAFGVHSAMPGKIARMLCPHAIWIMGDMDEYINHSNKVTQIIEEKAPVFEKSSIDEFYLDLTGMDRFFGCFNWTMELKELIKKESGLHVSFGLSVNKTVSKIATAEVKPNGKIQVATGHEKAYISPLPINKMPMVGKKTAEYLNSLGITDIATLAAMPMNIIESLFGKNGIVLWQRANAIDHTPVEPYSERKSISSEHTFDADTTDIAMIKRLIIKMAEGLAFNLRKEAWLTGCITIKLRYSNFDTYTRQVSVPYTASDDVLIQKAMELFDKLYERRMLIRLIGVKFGSLIRGHHQINIFDDTIKNISLYQALDKIRNKYGEGIVGRAV